MTHEELLSKMNDYIDLLESQGMEKSSLDAGKWYQNKLDKLP